MNNCKPTSPTPAPTPAPTPTPGSELLFTLTGCVENKDIDVYLLANKATTGFINRHEKHFVIQCTIDPKGITKIVSVKPGISDPTSALPPVTPSFSISMTIGKKTTGDRQQPLVIGQEYPLEITGPDSYYLYPQWCQASLDKNGNNGHDILRKGCSVTSDILGQFSPTEVTLNGSGPIQATMFGFRIVESETFYLVCEIKVCPDEGCGGTEKLEVPGNCSTTTTPATPTTASTASRRRRRDIQKHQERNLRNKRESKQPSNHVVTLLLNVQDEETRNINDVSSSSSGPRGIPSVLCCVLSSLIFGMKWSSWNIKAFN